MVRKNDQILGGLESEVCSWRTIMTLIGGLVALEWKMGMEKKKKKEEILAGGQSCAKRRKKEPFSLARKPPPPKDFEKKKSLRAEASFSLAMTLSLQRPLYLTDREE